MESEALRSKEGGHLFLEGLALIPVTQGISSSCQLSTQDVHHYQHDVPGSTRDPDFPGASLKERIPTPACLKDCDCSDIVRKKGGLIYGRGEVPTI